MLTFTVKRDGRFIGPCENGCLERRSESSTRRAATWTLTIIDHEILVCAPCGKQMVAAYESAGGTAQRLRARRHRIVSPADDEIGEAA
jgi:hypothetical protein